MDFRQLEAFVAVVEEGSFSRAGAVLLTAQSNISTRVKNLEAELGVTLIDRGTMEPTPEGRTVLERARRILQEEESIGADVRAMAESVQGEVSIGMIGTTGRWLIPQVLERQRAELPNVTLRIVEGTNSSLEPRISSGLLDLGILSLPLSNDSFRSEELFDEDLVLVAPLEGPRALRASQLHLTDLATLDLLLPLTGTPLRNEVDEACAQLGVILHPALEIDGIRTLASLCFDGLGYAVLPASSIPPHLRDEFHGIPISDLPQRRVALVLPPYGVPSAPTWAVHQLIKSVVANDARLPTGITRL
jgi:DNA-binding transcriptional LysR family regulator